MNDSEPFSEDDQSAQKNQEIQQLAEALYRERVLEARVMTPEEKFLAGEELFEYACSITLAGIRNQFPSADDEECRKILEQRLELRERLETPG
jgi:hypothetical protein